MEKNQFLILTMSLTLDVDNPAIKNLIQSSLESENDGLRLEWIPYEEIIDNVYSIRHGTIKLLLLGSNEECTPTLVSEFARIYSLPTHMYNNNDKD